MLNWIGYILVGFLFLTIVSVWRFRKIYAALVQHNEEPSFARMWKEFKANNISGGIDGVDGTLFWMFLVFGAAIWPVGFLMIGGIYLMKFLCATVIKVSDKSVRK